MCALCSLASVIVPARITDHEFIYYASVIAHEYYHAINGSEVTGESPFEMWLNEAVTVFIERMRAAALFGQDYMRLRHVRQAFAPHSGPIAQDWTPSAMAIEPLGFNTTHDLISSTTYAKGPEFIGMVSRMLGPDMFMRALDAYYVRFSHKTATTADWIACMEDVSGLELRNMAHGWLRRIGHPTLVLQSAQYDAAQHTYTIRLRQHGHAAHASHAHPGPWVFPVLWALVKDGRDLTSGTLHLDSESAQILVANVAAEPDFVSLGRGWSFFGRLDLAAMDARQLMCQARSDPDVCGRYFAFRRIAAQAKIAAAMDLRAGRLDRPVQADFVELYGSLLFDSSLCPGTRALILDDVRDIEGAPELAGCHDLLSKASRALLQAVWAAYADGVVKLAWDLHGADDKSQQHKTLPHRDLKRVCMQLMESSTGALDLALDLPHGCTAPSAAETAERVQSFARELALTAHYASDAVLGFRTFMRSNAADRLAVRASVRELWGTTAEGFEQYLSVITSLDSPDAVQIVRDTLNNDPLVNLKLAGHARYFARGWVSVPHRSIQTDDGLELLVEIFVRVALINAFSALPMLDAFGDLAKLEAAPQARLVAALRLMQAPLCADKHVSLWRRIDDLLGCVGAKTDRPQ